MTTDGEGREIVERVDKAIRDLYEDMERRMEWIKFGVWICGMFAAFSVLAAVMIVRAA